MILQSPMWLILLFLKTWIIWIYCWMSFKLLNLLGMYVYRRKIGIIRLKGKGWNCTNLHTMNTWFMHSTWIKTCFDFQPRQEIDLHQFNISWNLTPFVFCWKISTPIHCDAALGILTNDVAKCFLSTTNTKANILPAFCTRASLNLALSANTFVSLLLHYSFNKPQNFSKADMLWECFQILIW